MKYDAPQEVQTGSSFAKYKEKLSQLNQCNKVVRN